MKSPYQYPPFKTWFPISFGGGLFIAAFAYILNPEPLDFWRGLGLFGIFAMIFILGALIFLTSATILNRLVDHPVTDINSLVRGQTYWLNGEHPAIFVGVESYTGKLIFKIEGLKEDQFLLPGHVRLYISTVKEI